ncbi:Beta-amyrin 28-monooxygenase [Bienertia sinuspersici]
MSSFFLLEVAILLITLIVLLPLACQQISKPNNPKATKLPLGKKGWPIIGETLAFVLCPQKFILDRMTKYSPNVFQTYLAGEKIAVFCGASANKFIFSNEGKLVTYWLPDSVAKSLSYKKIESDIPSGKPTHDLSYKFLRVDSIQHYVPIVHSMVQQHLDQCWAPFDQVKAFTLAKEFTFALSCRVLVNSLNPSLDQVKQLAEPFFLLVQGIFSVPINLPGTPYYKAIKGGKLVKERLVEIIKQRRKEMIEANQDSNNDTKCRDLLGRLVMDSIQNDHYSSDEDIASKIVGFMFAGFYPTSTTIAFMINNLAEHPTIYEKVLQEQLEIAKSKEAKDSLTWVDVQKMKYSWNVICETMRLTSPVPGNFREVKTDFTYAGFNIPKGWKVHWSLYSTHKNPTYFSNPEKFDPSRFEGDGPAPYTFVPFGAGPRMCAGKEFARIEMLVFLHNVVTKFRFKKVNPNENVIYNPDPIPTQGLQVYLLPHQN